MDVKTRWIHLCQRLRSGSTPKDKSASATFGLLLPSTWRGKSTFQPTKAALLTHLLGANWYERMYKNRYSFLLSTSQLKQWSADPNVLATVQKNLLFFLDSNQSRNLSVVGYCQLLQTALEFRLTECFSLLWDQAFRMQWSPEESALLYMTQ